MITKDNLPKLLTALGFTKQGAIYRKTIAAAAFKVDTAKGEISYPAGVVVNGEFTCNFSSPENFVVLECVHRLIAKGYKPEHIELEPKWKLGHGASGGRADILVKDNIGAALLLIECKTAGSEFTKAWKKTLNDGDQLFSYAQQISETQFLCLYASDFENDTPTYTSHIIAHRDNEKYLADNPLAKSFKSVSDVKARYAVWHDTYKLDYTTKGIFEDSIQPYHIGKDKYSLDDLQAVSDSDQQKKYHEFATILRQHNVSGRENAFDKLVNLFLCKLVDETENPNELKFYWKGVAYDTHFELLDRLQQLYQAGMGKFLGEQITYINQNDVNNALRFIRQNPDATQRAVWNLFIQQKFFTNNDFSFIDVHNEKLFYQNAEVLLKILQMWQDIRLTNPTGHNQFLGDMFEGFLDQGVKQSEGQYFTPMPICRFILMSLPLENLISQHATPPKAIDYACGAGHFLNELATQIKPLVARHKQTDLTDYHKAIFGIEKEYRLSKVAKVSAFMYGQQNINICYGDALVNQHPAFAEIQDGSFDLLVANPPYSVRGFLSTLPDEERKAYSLTDTLNDFDTANSIETFFIERAKQLLKSGGVAALILPSSILSNGGNTYVKTREILLQYFDIVAIAEFGSGTFGKTGTNTVTLFLRRKPTAPDTAEHYRERVAHWFNTEIPSPAGGRGARGEGEPYQDSHFIAQYAAHIGCTLADYQTLLAGQPNDALLAHDTFAQYRKSFDASSEIVKLKAQKNFKAKSAAEQTAELDQRFLAFVSDIERDKLYHFVMASDQPNRVLVIRSPNDNKAQKQFLGYEWSSAKGNEGIKLVKNADGHHLTLLYDENNRDNADKLNLLIAANFQTVRCEPVEPCPSTSSGRTDGGIPPALSEYASLTRLVDMLDFSRVTFEKQITLTIQKRLVMQGKHPLFRLGDVVVFEKGVTYSKTDQVQDVTSKVILTADNITLAGKFEITKQVFLREDFTISESKRLKANDIFICLASGSRNHVGKVALIGEATGFYAGGFMGIIRTKGELNPKVLFEILNWAEIQKTIKNESSGSNIQNLSGSILEIKIPLPTLEIQQQIVAECEAVDAELEAAQQFVQTTKNQIRDVVSFSFGHYPKWSLEQIGELSRGASPRPIDAFLTEDTNGVPWIKIGDIATGEKYVRRTAQRITQEGAKKSRFVSKGDFIISNSMSVGRPYILDIDGCVHDGWLIVANIHQSVDRDYLYYALSSEEAQAQFQAQALGGVVQNLNINRAKSVTIAIPPLPDQQRLVADIQALENTIAQAQAIIAAAPTKKQAIMQRYL